MEKIATIPLVDSPIGRVSRIGFGGASISGAGGGYGFGEISELDSFKLLNKALEFGINIFDCAPIYGFETAEKRMGKAFKGKREQVKLISKAGITWHSTKRANLTNDPKTVKKMLHSSLKNFQSEYIDLYMIHWPDPRVDIRYAYEEIAKAKEEGKVRYLGLCNTNKSEISKALSVAPVDMIQNEFNIFNYQESCQLFPYLKEANCGFMGWGTFDKGIISQSVKAADQKFQPSDARSWAPWWKKEKNRREKKILLMEEIVCMFEKKENIGVRVALGHCLQFEQLTTSLCGIRSEEQLYSLCNSLKQLPAEDDLIKIREILSKSDIGN